MNQNRLRFVFDTNVLISALIFPGSIPEQAFRRAFEAGTLLISDETFDEIAQVIKRPKFDSYVLAPERDTFVSALGEGSVRVEITERVRMSPDPKDDKFLELALAGSADYLITGDRKHLLDLGGTFRGTRIVTARELLSLL